MDFSKSLEAHHCNFHGCYITGDSVVGNLVVLNEFGSILLLKALMNFLPTGAILSCWVDWKSCTRWQDTDSQGLPGKIKGECSSLPE